MLGGSQVSLTYLVLCAIAVLALTVVALLLSAVVLRKLLKRSVICTLHSAVAPLWNQNQSLVSASISSKRTTQMGSSIIKTRMGVVKTPHVAGVVGTCSLGRGPIPRPSGYTLQVVLFLIAI